MRTLAAIAALAWTCSLGVESREQPPLAPRLRADGFEVGGATFRTASPHGQTEVMESAEGVDIMRGAVREHLEVRGAQVEQTWTWTERPLDRGDVVVRVEVMGGRFVRADPRGLLLATAAGSLRYSHGTLIDARGARTPVPATFSDGAIELRVPERVLNDAAYPLVLDPTVGPEREVEAPDAGAAMFAPTARALWNGTNYVVLTASGSSIAAARVSTAGTILDSPARKLVDFGARIRSFDVATAAGRTLVYAATDDLTSARAALLSSDGASAGPPFAVAGTKDALDVRLAASATRFLAVTYRGVWPYSIFFTRLESDGTVIDSMPQLVASDARSASVASDGTDWLVAYLNRRTSPEQLAAVVVTNGGVVSSATALLNVSSYPRVPVTVFSRSADEYRIFSERKIHRVSTTGAAMGSLDFAPWGPLLWDTPAATHATWAEGTVIRDSTLDSSGALTTPAGNVIGTASFSSGGESELSVAVGASQALVSVAGHVGRFVPASGAALDTTLVPALIATRPQSLPAIASNGTDYFAAWFEQIKGAPTIRGVRLAPNGTSLDKANALGAVSEEFGRSELTFDGSSYFLARQISGKVAVERLASDRTVLGTTEIDGYMTYGGGIASTAGIIAVAGCPPCRVTRLDAKGAKLGSSALDAPVVQSVAGGGGKFLIAWSDSEGVRAVRLTTGGVVEDTAPLLIAKTSYPRNPRIAFDGSSFVVAYDEGGGAGNVRLRQVALDGTPSTSEMILGEGQSPAVAVSGDRVVVVWHTTKPGWSGSGRIVATMLPRGGSPSFSAPITIAENVPMTWGPRIATSVDGAFMVLYPRVDHTGTARVAAAPLTFGKMLGGACGATADCEGGTCVDGVCCERACSGACEACDVAGSAGHCVPVSGDPHGARSCGGFACDAGACRTMCTVNADCAASHACVAGTCTPSRAVAIACSRDDECASGFCTDGVCCDARCDHICEACDVPGSVGACTAATGRPRGVRAACPGVASAVCSQTVCDGVRRDTCAGYVSSEVICRAATCVGGSGTAEARCDGTGTCPAPVSVDCDGLIEEGGGCGCHTPGRQGVAGGLITALALAALARQRYRNSHTSRRRAFSAAYQRDSG